MARNLLVSQIVYRYPGAEDNTVGFTVDQDIVEFLGAKSIVSVGIQAPVGAKFQINDSEIMIGPAGVFELDNIIEITRFKILDESNLKRVIIDILYEKGV